MSLYIDKDVIFLYIYLKKCLHGYGRIQIGYDLLYIVYHY